MEHWLDRLARKAAKTPRSQRATLAARQKAGSSAASVEVSSPVTRRRLFTLGTAGALTAGGIGAIAVPAARAQAVSCNNDELRAECLQEAKAAAAECLQTQAHNASQQTSQAGEGGEEAEDGAFIGIGLGEALFGTCGKQQKADEAKCNAADWVLCPSTGQCVDIQNHPEQCCSESCPHTCCGNQCIDTDRDAANCGTCGVDCEATTLAVAPVCCSGVCTDVYNNADNCGSCGNACGECSVCVGTQCTNGCPYIDTCCSGKCVYTQTDSQNCGGCGNTCPAGLTCDAGSCCPSGEILCNGQCVSASDPNNCGRCGNQCTGCSQCTANSGGFGCSADCSLSQTCCNPNSSSSFCANTQTDVNNCGGCGIQCAVGTPCVGGQCQGCPDGGTVCLDYCCDTSLAGPQCCHGNDGQHGFCCGGPGSDSSVCCPDLPGGILYPQGSCCGGSSPYCCHQSDGTSCCDNRPDCYDCNGGVGGNG